MSRRRALNDLSAALQGRLDPDTDWMGLIELANRAFVTPAVFRALESSGALAQAPEDAVTFMAEVASRNDARNARLHATAVEAIGALNAAGIEPTLLKGYAVWASGSPPTSAFPRMMTDIDLLVRPDEVAPAMEVMQGAGFGLLARFDDPNEHVIAEFGRPQDVGLIDLHQRPNGPPSMAAIFSRKEHPVVEVWGVRARVPSPAYQLYLMCLHDQLHDGDYWRGGLDVRHMWDIAELARLPGGIGWDELDAILPSRLLRNAMHAQLIAAHRIAGADIPARMRRRLGPRLQHRRHIAQHLHPRWGLVLAGVGALLEGPNLLQHRAVARKGTIPRSGPPQRAVKVKAGQIKQIMKPVTGKI